MENNKRVSIKNKILILTIIIISILGITYKVFAWKYFVGGPKDYYSPPPWVGKGEKDGIVHFEGGDAHDATKQHDSGSTAVGVESVGGGGNSGGGGSWNGSTADFRVAIASTASSFKTNGKGEIWYEDLCEIKDLLCSEQGTPLTGKLKFVPDEKATGKYWAHDVDPNINPRDEITYNYDESYNLIRSIAEGDVKSEEYEKYYRTSCKYTPTDINCVNDGNGPAEAFVLSEARRVTGEGEKTPLQYAWWAVTGTGDGDNELSREAFKFQNYIEGCYQRYGKGKTENHTGTDDDGVPYSVDGFPIKYEPEFEKMDNCVTKFDSKKQQYIIGPFKINYYEESPFAQIDNIEIYIDDSQTPEDKENYYLAVSSDSDKNDFKKLEKGKYPSDGKEFYIILNYKEDFKCLTDIEVKFKYMNAGGNYKLYTGSYDWIYVQGHIYGEFDYNQYEQIRITRDWIARFLVDYAIRNSEEQNYYIGDGYYMSNLKIADELLKANLKFWEGWNSEYNSGGEPITTYLTGLKYFSVNNNNRGYFDDGGLVNTNKGYEIHLWTEKWANQYNRYVTNYENALSQYNNAADDDPNKATYKESWDSFDKSKVAAYRNVLENNPWRTETVSMKYPQPLNFKIWKDLEYKVLARNCHAQNLVTSGGAARWWQYTTINWKDNVDNEGKVKITKKIEPENQAKDGDVFNFTLKVTTDGKTVEEPLKIEYKEGQTEYSVTSKVYKWDKSQSAPTYEIIENDVPEGYSKNNVTITNRTGKLTDGKTAEVEVTNRLEEYHGTLKIKKKFEDTKLDDNQFLRQQIYEFEVKITGKCKFTYEGTVYNLGDNETKTITAKIDLSKGDTWTLDTFIWYRDNAPKYEVKEINTSPLKDANGNEYYYDVKLENGTGTLKNNDPVQVEVVNIQKPSSSSIKIIKEFEGQEKFKEEELKQMTFKFLVNVYSDEGCTKKLNDASGKPYEEEIVIATLTRAEKQDGSGYYWRWEGSSDEYVWLSGNYPYYTVKEDETWCPMHKDQCKDESCSYKNAIKFDSTNTKNVQSDGSIKGRFSNTDINNNETVLNITERTDTVNPINTLDNPTEGTIEINKVISQELNTLLKESTDESKETDKIELLLKVNGIFGFDANSNSKIDDDEWYYNKTIQISNKVDNGKISYVVLENEDAYDNQTFITFKKSDFSNATGEYIANWQSPKFVWYGEAPKIELTENLNGKSVTTQEGITKEIHSSGLPNGWKSLDDVIPEKNGKIYTYKNIFKIKNDIDEDEVGYIKIIKELQNQEFCTPDYIKSLKFKFKISVDGYNDEYVTLGDENHPVIYNEETNKYRWEYVTNQYSWVKGTNAPKYTVEEITDGLPDGIELVSTNPTTGDYPITGDLKPTVKNDSKGETVAKVDTIDCEFINKVNSNTKKLQIEKQFTDNNLINDNELSIKYKVTISGKFQYELEKYNGDYSFEVTVNKASNWKWESSDITWYGEAPTYTIEEIENDNTKLVSSQNATGRLDLNGKAIFVNEAQYREGYLSITKTIESNNGSAISDKNQEFTFKVTIKDQVQYIKIKSEETWISSLIKWKEGEKAPEYKVEEVDVPSGYTLSEIKNATGNLQEGKNTVEVEAINKIDEKKAQFKIAKEVIFNKLIDTAKNEQFDITVQIKGTFMMDGQILNDKTFNTKLGDQKAYISPTITWWGNNAPTVIVKEVQKSGWSTPLYSNNGDTGMVLQDTSGSNNLYSLNSIVITNRIQIEMDLTMKLAGVVWNDVPLEPDSKNTKDSVENGKYDTDKEEGIEGVQVKVYRVINDRSGKEVFRELATSYSDAFESITAQPILTAEDGSWQMTGLRVPAFSETEKSKYFTAQQIANRDFSNYSVKYDVEFIYDGQTYEPTKLLEFYDDVSDSDKKSTREEDYLSKPTRKNSSGQCGYFYDSLALDYDRDITNDRIREVYGKNPISGDGTTIGAVNGSDGEKGILYKADEPSEKNRVKSVLQTRYPESNVAYELYRTAARTSEAGLEFPVSKTYQLDYKGTQYTLNGTKQYYRALYEESLHINLGLKNRKTVDIDASKDLQSAKVIVDGKEIDYIFNSLSDILNKAEMNTISKSSETDATGYTYELGLYKTDYYYRAEIYKTNAEIYDNVQSYYKKISKGALTAENSEIEVFLTYRINLYNTSETNDYKVKINQINDYFDSSFGQPIQAQIMRVVNDEYKEVANASYLTKQNLSANQNNDSPAEENIGEVKWSVTEKNIKGSDGGTYNKMTADLRGLDTTISSGENRYIYVTFAVQKETVDEIEDCITLGNKSNIVEIANYTTYYSEGVSYHTHGGTVTSDGKLIAGKLDKDSAPDNVNIVNYNDEKVWYEDDTDAAPILNITLMDDNRKINGIAWEDKAESGTAQGNGTREDDEALIGGLTTELIEKIKLPEITDQGTLSGNYNEYDFLWPTSEKLDCLGGKTLKYLTGFDSTTETSREKVAASDTNEEMEVGQYRFTGIPTGTYAVRFLYGNNKINLEDTLGVDLKPAEALKADGSPFESRKTGQDGNNDGEQILTANYDEDWQGSTPAVYNGQDYKSTIYQAGYYGLYDDDSTGYLVNSYHDLTNENLRNAKVSDARDSEYRRLEVIAESETITNVNSSILDSATELSQDHNDLYKDYSMYADTANIDLNIESSTDVSNLKGVVAEENVEKIIKPAVQVNLKTIEFSVPRIDFGLIERPETKVVLDKEIKEIKLTTNDNNVIFDAKYNISYESISKTEDVKNRVVIGDADANNYLVAKVELDTESSKGIDVLQAISKNENKPENADNTGTQNFRFINVDSEILQGTTIELTYLISALNVGEIDYTSEKLEVKDDGTSDIAATKVTVSTENGDPSIDIKANIIKLAEEAKKANSTCKSHYGEYLGTTYYTGKTYNDTDQIVKSKVRQIIDYVDNDGVFTATYNSESEHMWRNTSINELTGAGYESNRLISRDTIPGYELLDKNNISYITGQRNNLILSVDDQNDYGADASLKSNKEFERKLVPYSYNNTKEKYSSEILLTVTKTVSAQDDADNLTYDNLTEIVKFENSVGRRDVTTVAGNANPRLGEFTTALKERDSSATELVTFTPPTGIEVEESMTTQILVIVILSLGVVVVGIVIIKKKILK